jgi:hypothetical protein
MSVGGSGSTLLRPACGRPRLVSVEKYPVSLQLQIYIVYLLIDNQATLKTSRDGRESISTTLNKADSCKRTESQDRVFDLQVSVAERFHPSTRANH